MPAGKWKVYDIAKKYLADGTLDLDETTNWKMALLSSTSNANSLALATPVYGSLTAELVTGNGYTLGGVAITAISLVNAANVLTWDIGDAARFAVVYKDATVNGIIKPILCVCLLDTLPADVTATAGNTLTIVINAAGILTLSGGNID
jgi:hypothetical protein